MKRSLVLLSLFSCLILAGGCATPWQPATYPPGPVPQGNAYPGAPVNACAPACGTPAPCCN